MLQNVIGYRSSSKTSASLVPSILGNEFLDYFLNKNPSIRLKLENDCKFAKPGFFTVTGFLDKIGAYEEIN